MSEDEDDLLDVAPGLPHSNILSETLAYVIGLALALILTGVSFWVASTGALWAPGVAVGLVRSVNVGVKLFGLMPNATS